MDEADTEIEMDDYRSAEIDDIFAQQQRYIYCLMLKMYMRDYI